MSQDKMLQVWEEMRDNQKKALEFQEKALQRSEEMQLEIQKNQKIALEMQRKAIETAKKTRLFSFGLIALMFVYLIAITWRQ